MVVIELICFYNLINEWLSQTSKLQNVCGLSNYQSDLTNNYIWLFKYFLMIKYHVDGE